jgi:hypothetical protein
VLAQHHEWLQQRGMFEQGAAVTAVTWTSWDLAVSLHKGQRGNIHSKLVLLGCFVVASAAVCAVTWAACTASTGEDCPASCLQDLQKLP